MDLLRIFRRRSHTTDDVRDKLGRFRVLVEANNKVLELIADAGEKLSGDFIFDIQYLNDLAAQVQELARSVVFNLNALTNNRYTRLSETLQRLEAELQAALQSRIIVPESPLVISLSEVTGELADVVGNKTARIGDLRSRLGCRTPDGFAVSAHACQQFLASAGIDLSEQDAAALHERVLAAPLPKPLTRAIERAVTKMKSHSRWAVRSSALGEDGALTFAGQFESLLAVPPDEVPGAYKRVVASLFSPGATAYRERYGLRPSSMPVACLAMVDARASGVLYTLDPERPERDTVLVTAAHGLGPTVVEGIGATDRFEVSRAAPHEILARHIGDKRLAVRSAAKGGVERLESPEADRNAAALTDDELREIVSTALRIEKYMKCAQDIEWAVDATGFVFLQSRPLNVTAVEHSPRDLSRAAADRNVLMSGRGSVACRGIAAGRVFRIGGEAQEVPEDAILVAATSTPSLTAAVTRAAAVITDVGTPTGHLAAVARELRVPTIVDTGDATSILTEGAEVTVDAEENIIYGGRVEELLRFQILRSSTYEDRFEFRVLRRMLKTIAPLNLTDPQSRSFNAEHCSTYHDIVRFAHEKAVAELVEGYRVRVTRNSRDARRLNLGIPIDLILIDLGGGLAPTTAAAEVEREAVTSVPLRAVLDGMLAEGAWATGPADMDLDGFMASATRTSELLAAAPEQNLAIVSGDYLNLSLRLGYHFNILDCYVTEQRNDNYIYFRFAGGVTELERRSRRASLLCTVLEHYGFVVEAKGDLVIARLKKLARDDVVERLRMLGRLIGFTRQLDIFLRDDSLVEHCATRFLQGKYDLFHGDGEET